MSPGAEAVRPTNTEALFQAFWEERQQLLDIVGQTLQRERFRSPADDPRIIGFLFDFDEREFQCAALLLASKDGGVYALSGKDFSARAKLSLGEEIGPKKARELLSLRENQQFDSPISFFWYDPEQHFRKYSYNYCDRVSVVGQSPHDYVRFAFERSLNTRSCSETRPYKNALVLADGVDEFLGYDPKDAASLEKAARKAQPLLFALNCSSQIPRMGTGHAM